MRVAYLAALGWVALCTSSSPVVAVTVDFDDLVLGTVYQPPVPPPPAPTFTSRGVGVAFEPFIFSNGNSTLNFAEVEGNQQSGGSGNDLEVNNVGLFFDLSSLPPTSEISLLFGEFGGNLNLRINGDFRNFDDFQDVNGVLVGGVMVDVPTGGFGQDIGKIRFSGAISDFAIGGQELWIDDVKIVPEATTALLLSLGLCFLSTRRSVASRA